MSHIDEFFPSKWLKASDLQGKTVKVTIAGFQIETMRNRDGKDERKLVVTFLGKDKGVMLNKTNAESISTAYGYDYTAWKGCQITLFPAMVDAFGETQEAIRIRVTPENIRASADQRPQVEPERTDSSDEESLPF